MKTLLAVTAFLLLLNSTSAQAIHRQETPPEELPAPVTPQPPVDTTSSLISAITSSLSAPIIPLALTIPGPVRPMVPAPVQGPVAETTPGEVIKEEAGGSTAVGDKPTHSGGENAAPAAGGGKGLGTKEKRYLEVASVVAEADGYIMDMLGIKSMKPEAIPSVDTDWIHPSTKSGPKVKLPQDIGERLSVKGSPFKAQAEVVELVRELGDEWGNRANTQVVATGLHHAAEDFLRRSNLLPTQTADSEAARRAWQTIKLVTENYYGVRPSKSSRKR